MRYRYLCWGWADSSQTWRPIPGSSVYVLSGTGMISMGRVRQVSGTMERCGTRYIVRRPGGRPKNRAILRPGFRPVRLRRPGGRPKNRTILRPGSRSIRLRRRGMGIRFWGRLVVWLVIRPVVWFMVWLVVRLVIRRTMAGRRRPVPTRRIVVVIIVIRVVDAAVGQQKHRRKQREQQQFFHGSPPDDGCCFASE